MNTRSHSVYLTPEEIRLMKERKVMAFQKERESWGPHYFSTALLRQQCQEQRKQMPKQQEKK